jgi:hypothetical protein
MDATLVDMGYRGEDASSTRADSWRQLPWRSSSGTGSGGMGSWNEGSPSYNQDDEYARPDGYGGFPQSGSQAEYEAEYEEYGQPAGYGQPAEYGHPAGYGQGDYGYPAGTYGQQADYGGDYRADGYGESGGHPALPSGYGQSGGYPAQDAGYGQSGGYPAQDARPARRPDVSGRYAGNDWYIGQPGAASGSGFADTGTFTMDARAIDAYGSGGNASGGYPQNGYQPHGYEQDGYDGYQGGASQLTVHDPVRGFPPTPAQPVGFDGHDEFDGRPGYLGTDEYEVSEDYGEPNGFDAHGYDSGRGYEFSPAGEYPADYDDYPGEDDPYRYGYGDGMAPRPGSTKTKGGKKKTAAKRRRRRLLLAALVVVVVGVLGAAAYVFVLKPKPSAGPSMASAGPLPTAGSASAATAACVKQFGEYCHIQLRTDDPAPLTAAELFPPAFLNETDHSSFTRVGTRLDKTCSAAVIGQDLIKALQAGKCTQVLRASYVSGDNKIMGTIGVVNLATTNEAHYAGKVVGATDFIAPLSTTKGMASKLGKGTGVVEAQFKGHYLILTWAEFTNATVPKTAAQSQQLEQFENDLVAGTANISLSERMVNGAPATAAS